MSAEKTDERKYVSFPLTFSDPWEGKEVELSFRFAKPTKTEIKRLQDTAGKNASGALITAVGVKADLGN